MKKEKFILLIFILLIGVSVPAYFWYQKSCFKDHSKSIKNLGTPLQQSVLSFFKEHRYYPSSKEFSKLLKKVGCTNISQRDYIERKSPIGEGFIKSTSFNCKYKSKSYIPYQTLTDLGDRSIFKFTIIKENTACEVTFNSDGNLKNSLNCKQIQFCINVSH